MRPRYLGRSVAVAVALILLASNVAPALAQTHAYAGWDGTTTYRGMDGFIRQSTTSTLTGTQAHSVWINLCNSTCSEWVQTGTYQGTFPGGTSRSVVHVFYENVNPCGDYGAGDVGAPPSANYPYYLSHDGTGLTTVGCANGSHKSGYRFNYRKGSFGSTPFFNGYMSSNYDYPFANTEVIDGAPINTDYFGCQDVAVCSNASYGLHVYTGSSTWISWTGPALVLHDNPPWLHTYNNYWSFRTCPTSC